MCICCLFQVAMGVVCGTQRKYLNPSKQETWFEKSTVYLYMNLDMKLFQWSLHYELKHDDKYNVVICFARIEITCTFVRKSSRWISWLIGYEVIELCSTNINVKRHIIDFFRIKLVCKTLIWFIFSYVLKVWCISNYGCIL
jgi:hypothetical protein